MSTTYGAMLILAVLSVVMYVAVGVANLADYQQAVAAADLSAVSAASDLLTGGNEPCATARTIAELNQTSVSDCQVEEEFVRVTVAVKKRVGGSAVALAGPVG